MTISEGKVSKGGVNRLPPVTKRPAPPKGQNSKNSSTVMRVIRNGVMQFEVGGAKSELSFETICFAADQIRQRYAPGDYPPKKLREYELEVPTESGNPEPANFEFKGKVTNGDMEDLLYFGDFQT